MVEGMVLVCDPPSDAEEEQLSSFAFYLSFVRHCGSEKLSFTALITDHKQRWITYGSDKRADIVNSWREDVRCGSQSS
jgi:hypothetical protein